MDIEALKADLISQIESIEEKAVLNKTHDYLVVELARESKAFDNHFPELSIEEMEARIQAGISTNGKTGRAVY